MPVPRKEKTKAKVTEMFQKTLDKREANKDVCSATGRSKKRKSLCKEETSARDHWHCSDESRNSFNSYSPMPTPQSLPKSVAHNKGEPNNSTSSAILDALTKMQTQINEIQSSSGIANNHYATDSPHDGGVNWPQGNSRGIRPPNLGHRAANSPHDGGVNWPQGNSRGIPLLNHGHRAANSPHDGGVNWPQGNSRGIPPYANS